MSQKVKQILIGVVALAVVLGGFFLYRNVNGDHGDKKIHVKIVDLDNVVCEFDEKTNAAYLADALKEMAEEGDIVLEYQDGNYGMYITGLGKSELINEDPMNSIYWVYESENNAMCQASGYCDGANILEIADGDSFVFLRVQY